jgi:hypothetical protein
MTILTYQYIAQIFRPREGAESILLFVAPASHIRGWAGVPRKAFDYQHGFQRTLEATRIGEVASFFNEDLRNVTPTSVVVGFTGDVKIEDISGASDDFAKTVRLTVTVPDLADVGMEELATQTLAILRARLPADVVEQIEQNIDIAIEHAVQLENEDVVDESFGIQGDNAIEQGFDVNTTSYLGDFYARLLGCTKGLTPWPKEDQLREILYSFLKPGIIVDGQHRVFGAATADENMLLAVCAIPHASWAESVYQFVVINQKARPIKPAFLSSIIATSLNEEEISAVYSRLGASRIDVGRADMMERVNTDAESPFKGMIDFGVQGAPGFLQFPGMSSLASEFSNIPRRYPVLLRDDTWATVEGDWLSHFFAFWRGIRVYFETSDPRLWKRPSDSNPHNLLKIVSLQEIQRLMLSNWADSRLIKLKKIEDTEKQSLAFWEDFPKEFFTDEWRKKGLQTTVGRELLARAIIETRRNIGRKSWGHRRLSLFQD